MISAPGMTGPQVPAMNFLFLPHVCGPVFSDMPYTSTMLMVSVPK